MLHFQSYRFKGEISTEALEEYGIDSQGNPGRLSSEDSPSVLPAMTISAMTDFAGKSFDVTGQYIPVGPNKMLKLQISVSGWVIQFKNGMQVTISGSGTVKHPCKNFGDLSISVEARFTNVPGDLLAENSFSASGVLNASCQGEFSLEVSTDTSGGGISVGSFEIPLPDQITVGISKMYETPFTNCADWERCWGSRQMKQSLSFGLSIKSFSAELSFPFNRIDFKSEEMTFRELIENVLELIPSSDVTNPLPSQDYDWGPLDYVKEMVNNILDVKIPGIQMTIMKNDDDDNSLAVMIQTIDPLQFFGQQLGLHIVFSK